MPIKDLSENVRMPRLGKIRLGIKVPVLDKNNNPVYRDGKPVMRPEKTDYFVLPKKGESGHEELLKFYGEKPKELTVLIPLEDEERWAEQYYKMYSLTRGLICKGDGVTAIRMIDSKTKGLPTKTTETISMVEMPCPGKECPEYQKKDCGETMNLRFMLPDIPGLGIWQIDTGSINSILNINSCAKVIKKAFGRITMIPLILSLEPVSVTNPDTGKKQTVYVLNLRTKVTLRQLAEQAREQSKVFMLESPDLEAEWNRQAHEDIEDLFGDGTAKSAPVNVNKVPGEIIDAEVIPPNPPPVQGMAPATERAGGDVPPPVKQAKKEQAEKPSKVQLMALKFANAGEFFQACYNHFGRNQTETKKEIPEYDLSKPAQREKAWQQIVGTFYEGQA